MTNTRSGAVFNFVNLTDITLDVDKADENDFIMCGVNGYLKSANQFIIEYLEKKAKNLPEYHIVHEWIAELRKGEDYYSG